VLGDPLVAAVIDVDGIEEDALGQAVEGMRAVAERRPFRARDGLGGADELWIALPCERGVGLRRAATDLLLRRGDRAPALEDLGLRREDDPRPIRPRDAADADEVPLVGDERARVASAEADLVREVDRRAAPHAEGRRRPLADAVHGQDRRLLERRWIERARRVRLAVVAEDVNARAMVGWLAGLSALG
jgi:hypothetical protein